jgi:hypothetical protein
MSTNTRTDELMKRLGTWGLDNDAKLLVKNYLMLAVSKGERGAMKAVELLLQMDGREIERVKFEDMARRLDDGTPTAVVGVEGLDHELQEILGAMPRTKKD